MSSTQFTQIAEFFKYHAEAHSSIKEDCFSVHWLLTMFCWIHSPICLGLVWTETIWKSRVDQYKQESRAIDIFTEIFWATKAAYDFNQELWVCTTRQLNLMSIVCLFLGFCSGATWYCFSSLGARSHCNVAAKKDLGGQLRNCLRT